MKLNNRPLTSTLPKSKILLKPSENESYSVHNKENHQKVHGHILINGASQTQNKILIRSTKRVQSEAIPERTEIPNLGIHSGREEKMQANGIIKTMLHYSKPYEELSECLAHKEAVEIQICEDVEMLIGKLSNKNKDKKFFNKSNKKPTIKHPNQFTYLNL